MRKALYGFGFLAFAAVGCAAPVDEKAEEVQVEPTDPAVVAQSFDWKGVKRQIVVFKTDTLPADAAARLGKAGARVRKTIGSLGVATVDADAPTAAKIAKDSSVAFIGTERAWRLPKLHKHAPRNHSPAVKDFLYGAQWDIRRVHAPGAWANVPLAKQAKVTVAVLDVGVMSDHPDLAGKVVSSIDTSYSHRADNDCPSPLTGAPAAYPDYFTRINLSTGAGCEFVNDADSIQGHGTHVSGTVAGNLSTDDPSTGGIVGVGPGLNIAAYKVFDRVHMDGETGELANGDILNAFDGPILDAIADASEKGIPVINMSLGGHVDRTDPDQEADWQAWNRAANLATRRGTLIVASAGNEEARTGTKKDSVIPSDLPAVVSVSATGTSKLTGPFDPANGIFGPIDAAPKSDVLAFYSNYGRAVDVSAPGGDCGPGFDEADPTSVCDSKYLILSSVPFYDPAVGIGVDWAWYAGTSMASPHVAAVAALIKAKHPNWGPLLIRAQLQFTTQSVGSFWNPRFGTGIVDAERATR